MSEQVREVAGTARILWSRRTEADYDHFAEFGRGQVQSLIDAASSASRVLDSDAFAQSRGGGAFLNLIRGQVG